MQALWMWRQFPKQIASDLSQFHRRRIAEWHRGDMSSYELLELLEYMDDHGQFKKALRNGEYTEEELSIRHLANEVARLRATMHAVHGGQKYEPPLLLSKAGQRAEAESAEETAELREGFFSLGERDFDEIDA